MLPNPALKVWTQKTNEEPTCDLSVKKGVGGCGGGGVLVVGEWCEREETELGAQCPPNGKKPPLHTRKICADETEGDYFETI